MEVRRVTIGSSDVPAVVGVSPWKTRVDVLRAKLDPAKVQGEPQFLVGHKLEKPIAELAIELGLVEEKFLFGGWTVVKDGWMSATPDFYALKTGNMTYRKTRPLREDEATLIEVKVVGYRVLGHWDWGRKVPDYVAAQCQWQMSVLKHSKMKVAALLGGAEVKVFDLERDDAWIEKLTRECREFWEQQIDPNSSKKRGALWARLKLEQLRGGRRAA